MRAVTSGAPPATSRPWPTSRREGPGGRPVRSVSRPASSRVRRSGRCVESGARREKVGPRGPAAGLGPPRVRIRRAGLPDEVRRWGVETRGTCVWGVAVRDGDTGGDGSARSSAAGIGDSAPPSPPRVDPGLPLIPLPIPGGKGGGRPSCVRVFPRRGRCHRRVGLRLRLLVLRPVPAPSVAVAGRRWQRRHPAALPWVLVHAGFPCLGRLAPRWREV